mgnify:CR=1 FL=1
MKHPHYALLVAVAGFAFLIHAQLTPRPVQYSIKELELYTQALDSLRAENTRLDSMNQEKMGELKVMRWNMRGMELQMDLFERNLSMEEPNKIRRTIK